MTNNTSNDSLVIIKDNQPITTSQQIAISFGKEHRHVLDSIRNLAAECAPEFGLPNFRQTVVTRKNPGGGADIKSPAYELTRDGFTLLAMGFTGKRALQFKLAYIDAFNQMEAQLRGQLATVRPHTRRLPTVRVQKELTLSDKEHRAIGGIVKRCVAAELRTLLPAVIKAQEPKKPSIQQEKLQDVIKAINAYASAVSIRDSLDTLLEFRPDMFEKADKAKDYMNKVAQETAKSL